MAKLVYLVFEGNTHLCMTLHPSTLQDHPDKKISTHLELINNILAQIFQVNRQKSQILFKISQQKKSKKINRLSD